MIEIWLTQSDGLTCTLRCLAQHRNHPTPPGNLQERVSRTGNPYYSFDLGDGKALNRVFLFGQAPCRTEASGTVDGRGLDVGAGSGYFTPLIAAKATSVVALETVPDMQRVRRARCDGISNVEVVGIPALELGHHLAPGSVDSVLIVQNFHHFHRRPESIQAHARVLRSDGRLFMLEPYHNLRRVVRLFRHYLSTDPRPTFWAKLENWATHDS